MSKVNDFVFFQKREDFISVIVHLPRIKQSQCFQHFIMPQKYNVVRNLVPTLDQDTGALARGST
jgi:hypothetical protein